MRSYIVSSSVSILSTALWLKIRSPGTEWFDSKQLLPSSELTYRCGKSTVIIFMQKQLVSIGFPHLFECTPRQFVGPLLPQSQSQPCKPPLGSCKMLRRGLCPWSMMNWNRLWSLPLSPGFSKVVRCVVVPRIVGYRNIPLLLDRGE